MVSVSDANPAPGDAGQTNGPDELEGPVARVQEAAIAGAVAVLKTRLPGETLWIVVSVKKTAEGRASGLLRAATRKEVWGGRLPPGLEREKRREDALLGARIVAITHAGVLLDQGGVLRELRPKGDRLAVTDPPALDGHAANGGESAYALELLDPDQRAELEARGDALAASIADAGADARRATIHRAIDKALIRIDRRICAISRDISNIAEAGRVAEQASWLIAEAKRAPRGAKELVVTDWTTGEPVELVVALDPSKPATVQVEAMFRRAKRLRLGARIAEERNEQAKAQRARLAELLAAIDDAPSLVAIEELAREAKRTAPRDLVLTASTSDTPRSTRRDAPNDGTKGRTPYRSFVATSGRRLLVGKGAADNDALTLKVARPHDLWLHAKDRTGAHVIVPLDKGHTCPGADLVEAAHLAAHFSDARGEALVDVQYVPRKHLRKPKGSAPGFVVVDREKVLVLRVDPGMTRDLLEREET